MTLELAKQLQDSGFPMPKGIEARKCGPDLFDYGPALSELIGTLGSDFHQLSRYSTPWGDELWRASLANRRLMVSGTSREEAVALLWLAVHPSTFSAEEA